MVDLLIRQTAKFRPGGSRVHLGQAVPLLVEGWKQNRDNGGRTNIREIFISVVWIQLSLHSIRNQNQDRDLSWVVLEHRLTTAPPWVGSVTFADILTWTEEEEYSLIKSLMVQFCQRWLKAPVGHRSREPIRSAQMQQVENEARSDRTRSTRPNVKSQPVNPAALSGSV